MSLLAAIQRHAGERPDAVAIRHPEPFHGWGRLTWRALAEEVGAVHRDLDAGRALQGDGPIGWLQHNHAHALVTLIACEMVGRAFVPLNWRLAEAELRHIATDCGLVRVLPDAARAPGEAAEGPVPCGLVHPWRDGREPLIADRQPACVSSHRPAAELDRVVLRPHPPQTPLLIGYTSGTTGRPKGAVLTRAAVAANIAHAQAVFGFTPEDRVLTVLPLFHLGGLCIQTLPALLAGAEILLHPKFDPGAFFDTVEQHRPTLTLLVPAVMAALVRHPRWVGADLSCLRAVGAGSSEVPLPLIEAFHAKGVPVQQVYGMTEAGPIALAQSVADAWAHPGALGFPVGDCAARIGAEGEIQLRGPNLFSAYHGLPDATRDAFTEDGWFRTGDVGRRDAEGRFWFTDRLKRVIISGGENIYPAELERVLAEIPGLTEFAVIGRPDARWGEVPVAVIVAADDFDEAAIAAAFAAKLARFKHPRAVLRLPGLPRTALGKVRIEKLRELVLS